MEESPSICLYALISLPLVFGAFEFATKARNYLLCSWKCRPDVFLINTHVRFRDRKCIRRHFGSLLADDFQVNECRLRAPTILPRIQTFFLWKILPLPCRHLCLNAKVSSYAMQRRDMIINKQSFLNAQYLQFDPYNSLTKFEFNRNHKSLEIDQ